MATVIQVKDLIDDNFENFSMGLELDENEINTIIEGVNNVLDLRDYLFGLPQAYDFDKCVEFVSYLNSFTSGNSSRATSSVLAFYAFENGDTITAQELANYVSENSPQYSFVKLLQRVIDAEWPASMLTEMRDELHDGVVENITNADKKANDEIDLYHT